MDKAELYSYLKTKEELIPDEHDGSYELVHTIVGEYAKLDNLDNITTEDLNAIYLMAVGTWRHRVDKKKESVAKTCLPQSSKDLIINTLDKVWDNACNDKYENGRGHTPPQFGMFGTGFYSFKTEVEGNKAFIQLMIDLLDVDDDETAFAMAEPVLAKGIKGIGTSSASIKLHCLKPYIFPIINSVEGMGTIFQELGVDIQSPNDIKTYISNCRKIKEFRDSTVSFKNYRVFDLMVYELKNDDKLWPSLEEYDPKITSEQYYETFKILKDEGYTDTFDTVYYLYKIDKTVSCKYIADVYGNTAQHYNRNAVTLAKAVKEKTGCPDVPESVGSSSKTWPILFLGRDTKKEEAGIWRYCLRTPLAEAIALLDDEGFFDFLKEKKVEDMSYEKNMILYGPPGTGKTYNTIVYAVAIIEKKEIESVMDEAAENYSSVKERFEQYKAEGKIAFTTFHQSYGYEEFIEGIKPVFDDEESDIGYKIEDGMFKKFCDSALIRSKKTVAVPELGKNPSVWKVSLGGTYENPLREECLKNNHIRIGWDSYGEFVDENTDYAEGGRVVINSFINKMQVGDIVLSCYSASTIDAIGVVTGEYRWDDEYSDYKRVRDVKWIVKGFKHDIKEINGGKTMTLSTVYQMNISLADVLDLIDMFASKKEETKINPDNFVFIIDEINRGNISKIFGELITLIEPTKRIGADEELTAVLPYSNRVFGVPANVHILGTMNTADRSIAIMDTALRRRFAFVEMMPDSSVLANIGADKLHTSDGDLDVAKMLDTINKRIEYLYDREHTIGHAFFTPLAKENTIEKLADIFENKIIPLLQEYFYEDYSKIQLVLGDDGKTGDNKKYQFIRDEHIDVSSVFMSAPDIDIPEVSYTIQKSALFDIQSYKKIGKGL